MERKKSWEDGYGWWVEMKVWYDGEVDTLYVSLRRGPAYDSEELSPDVRGEYDEKGIAKEIATQLKETVATKTPFT